MKRTTRVSAVTVCLAYSDYLSCCLENRKHFDSWVIVTAVDDVRTKRLAKKAGLIATTPPSLRPEQVGFHAGFGKSQWINAGLRELRQRLKAKEERDRWVIILDADTLLSPDFGERLEHLLPLLDKNKLYGLYGRRIAETATEFASLRAMGVWEDQLDYSPTIIGYFNLFHLDGPHGRYLPSDPERIEHDDGRFYALFGKKQSAHLPLTALHLGATAANWAGQRDALNENEAAHSSRIDWNAILPKDAEQKTAVIYGQPNVETLRAFGERFSRVEVVFSTPEKRSVPRRLLAADRAFLLERLRQVAQACPNIHFTSAGRTAPERVDWIHLAQEPNYAALIEQLPKWTAALAGNGWLSGTHYGFPGFAHETRVVETVVGTPDVLTELGGWAIRSENIHRQMDGVANEAEGIALWIPNGTEEMAAVRAIYSIRKRWRGALAVIKSGADSSGLRVIASRKHAKFMLFEARREMNHPGLASTLKNLTNEEEKLLMFLVQPFSRTIWITPQDVMPEFERILRRLARTPVMAGDGECIAIDREAGAFDGWKKTMLRGWKRKDGTFAAEQTRALKALGRRAPRAKPTTVLADLNSDGEIMADNRASIWIPEDAVIVTAVQGIEDMQILHQNWHAMAWPAGRQRIVVKASACHSLRVPDGCSSIQLSRAFEQKHADQPWWNLALYRAGQRTTAKYLLYMDPYLSPVPGAQLFYQAKSPVLGSGGWCFIERSQRVLKVAKIGPPSTLVERSWFVQWTKRFLEQTRERNLEVFLHEVLTRAGIQPWVEDVMHGGWNR